MAGISLEDFSQSVAYREIFELGELDITSHSSGAAAAISPLSKTPRSEPCPALAWKLWLRLCWIFRASTTSMLGWQWVEWVRPTPLIYQQPVALMSGWARRFSVLQLDDFGPPEVDWSLTKAFLC